MPYKTKSDLAESVKARSTVYFEDIYKAFQQRLPDQYKDKEDRDDAVTKTAHKWHRCGKK